jgi:hypothetical protein
MLELFNRKQKAQAAVEHVFDKYADQVAANPALESAVNDFKNRKKAIEAYKVPERQATVPVTGDKLDLLNDVFVNAETERNAVILYAQDHKLPELEGKMPRKVAEMYKGTAEERLRRYQTIHDEAKAIQKDLLLFGCGAEVIAEMDEQLPLLRQKLAATQNAIDDRLAKQGEFEQLFLDMDAFIKSRLDRAVRTRIKTSPEFVAEYRTAKVMPKSPVRSPKDATAVPKKKTEKKPTPAPSAENVSFRDEPTTEPVQTDKLAENGAVGMEV